MAATFDMQLHTVDPVREIADEVPGFDITMHVDDLCHTVSGDTDEEVICTLRRSQPRLFRCLRSKRQLTVEKKAMLYITSDACVGDKLRRICCAGVWRTDLRTGQEALSRASFWQSKPLENWGGQDQPGTHAREQDPAFAEVHTACCYQGSATGSHGGCVIWH